MAGTGTFKACEIRRDRPRWGCISNGLLAHRPIQPRGNGAGGRGCCGRPYQAGTRL